MPTEAEAARCARILADDLARQKLGLLTLYGVPSDAKPLRAPVLPRRVARKAPARGVPKPAARASRESRQLELEERRRGLFRAFLDRLPSAPARQFKSDLDRLRRDLEALNAEYGAVAPPAPRAKAPQAARAAPRAARASPRPLAVAQPPLRAADENPFRGEWECTFGDIPPDTPPPQQLIPLAIAAATRDAPRVHQGPVGAGGGVEGRSYTLQRSDQPTESNFKGVHKTPHGTWQAQIWDQNYSARNRRNPGGGLRSVGNYATARDAALAIAIAKQHKTFARHEIVALMNDVDVAQIFEL